MGKIANNYLPFVTKINLLLFLHPEPIIRLKNFIDKKTQDKPSFRFQSFLLHRKPEFTAKTPDGILVQTLDLFCHYATRLNYLRLVICQKNLVHFRKKLGIKYLKISCNFQANLIKAMAPNHVLLVHGVFLV